MLIGVGLALVLCLLWLVSPGDMKGWYWPFG